MIKTTVWDTSISKFKIIDIFEISMFDVMQNNGHLMGSNYTLHEGVLDLWEGCITSFDTFKIRTST